MLLDLIYPKHCLECKKDGRYICKKCVRKLIPSYPICPYCNKFSFEGKTHTNCGNKLGLDQLTSLWKYEGVIRKAILVLKYKFVLDISEDLSDLVYREVKKRKINFGKNVIFTSVPLYKKRLLFRGFNQSEKIIEKVTERLNFKFIPDLLIRCRNTEFQTNLTKKERLKNLKNAFQFNNKYKIKNRDRKIVIFDDVWTTGATIKEMAKVLKKKGINNVVGLTIAKR